jgi:ribosomal-protein-alanine N-acetyltransferase
MFEIRRAVPSDLLRLIEIARGSGPAPQWPEREYEKILAAEKDFRRILLVAQKDGEVHGFLVGNLAGDDWEIENIVVEARWQRKGLGSQLICEFLDYARENGRPVFLEVRVSNIAARKLYEKIGFVQVGQRKAYYQHPAEDALILKISF